MKKKVLSLFLVLSMLFGMLAMMPISVSAATEYIIEDVDDWIALSEMSSVGEAIRRMTALPATVFRIPDRGFIRKGYFADLVIFDPEKLDSLADFSRNDLFPKGIDKVIVNGQIAWNSAAPEQIGRHGRFIAVN